METASQRNNFTDDTAFAQKNITDVTDINK